MSEKRRRSDDLEPRSKAELAEDIAALEAGLGASAAHLLNELQTYHIKLEMQNHELRETQQQLEETRDRYADLYDFSPVGYLTLDEAGRVLDINLTGAEIVGKARAALIGTPLAPRIVIADIQPFLQHLRQTFHSSGNVVAELKIRQPNGAQRYIRLESRAVKNAGEQPRTCRTVMIDTTEQHVVSGVLQQLRSEQRALLSTIPAIVYYKDLDLRYTAVSQACAEFVGLKVQGMIGKTDFDLFPAEQALKLQRLDRSVLDSGRALVDMEKPLPDRHGVLHWFNYSLAPFFGPDRKVSGLVGVRVDITAVHMAEQHTHDVLRENRQLTQRLFTLQEAERRYIAQELHDELGQWLTAIEADAEAICRVVHAQSAIGKGAHAIRQSAGHVHEVIRRITRQLRPSLLDELGLVDSLRELVAQWQKHHAEIACELTFRDSCVQAAEEFNITVYRIVQEALTNIAQHAKARHVTVALNCIGNNAGLKHAAEAGKPLLLLTIDDDGKGMHSDYKANGLGLLGMRERVIAAGGEFSLRSEPGQGVHIQIRLPLGVAKEENNEPEQD